MVLPDAEQVRIVWPARARVRAVVTTRHGGVSEGRYGSFNLATHCGDELSHVLENRRRLTSAYRIPPVCWLDQVHGREVIDTAEASSQPPSADASLSRSAALACAILTADCLPVLMCDRDGTVVGAAHCGWRGLAAGVLGALVRRLNVPGDDLLAWLGPAIGPAHYQIGEDVREALLDSIPASDISVAVTPSSDSNRWQADLYAVARAQLNALGVTAVFGGGFCTYRETRFYSYRRDGVTGRIASLIWLSDEP